MIYAPNEVTPLEAVDDIKHLISGKVVYDLGAGEGNWAKAMSLYASKVICVEADSVLAKQCFIKDLRVELEDYLLVDISRADVLYIFMSFYGTMMLTKRLIKEDWHGTIISHYYPLHLNMAQPIKPDLFINGLVPFLIYNL